MCLEPNGWQTGCFTDSEFYQLGAEVLLDFVSKTGLVRKIYNIPLSAGTAVYTVPDACGEVLAVNANRTHVDETSGFYLDNSDATWNSQTGPVVQYRQDELAPKQIQTSPIPSQDGYQVDTTLGQGGYGVLSATTEPNDFDVTGPSSGGGPAIGAYGTQSAAGGNPYVETTNPGYGVRASIIPSLGNLQVLGTALPFNLKNINAQTILEIVPDSAWCYIKYGILARIFGSDSEMKDTQRAAYSAARFAEGINLWSAILTNLYEEN